LKEMPDPIVKDVSMDDMHLNVDLVMKLFEEIASMHLDLSGILSILLVLTAKNHSLEEVSSNLEESPIVKLIIINRLALSVLVVVNPSLDDVSTLLTRNGIQNILFVLSA